MLVTKVELKARTVSWRPSYARFSQPHFLNDPAGYPPPDLTIIWGLLSAALGKQTRPNFSLQWRCEQTVLDLQTIHSFEAGKGKFDAKGKAKPSKSKRSKTTVAAIPVGWNARCLLHIVDEEADIYDSLKKPTWPISFGRSEDLATVSSLERVELDKCYADDEELLYFVDALIPDNRCI